MREASWGARLNAFRYPARRSPASLHTSERLLPDCYSSAGPDLPCDEESLIRQPRPGVT
jgi:hypothetical protein